MTPPRAHIGTAAVPPGAGWTQFDDSRTPSAARSASDGNFVAAPRPRVTAAQTEKADVDGVFAFALFATMLFILQLGTLGAVLFLSLVLVYAGLRWNRLYEILRPRAFLLCIPVLIVFSTVWSERPVETFKYSLEFAATFGAALLLSGSRRPHAILFGIFLAFACYTLVSLTFGQSVGVGTNGATAFSGLNRGKNMFGDTTSTGLLISAAIFLAGIEGRRPLRVMLAVLIGLAELYAVLQARSAGAVLGLGLAACAFIFLLGLRSSVLAVRGAVTALLGLGLVGAALFYRTLSGALIDGGVQFFDKDPTLTGRTYLWQRASDLIAEKPVFGKGFDAFWIQGNTDAEGLWRYAGITSRDGFNFHNTFIDILVQLGWFGLTVIALIMLVALVILVIRFITKPSLVLCFWLSMIVYQMVRMPIEYIGFTEFYYASVLLFAALASAFPAARTAPMQAPVPRASALQGVRPHFGSA
jgi:exopolysaccharide production protein ExoQ